MPNTYFGQTTPTKSTLGREPYFSRFTQFESQDKNYILIGFTPGLPVQAAELNELQDNFQKNLTLSNYLFSNWVPYVTQYLRNNENETVDSILWNGAVPIDPALVTATVAGLRFGRGWYYYTHASGLCYWVHLVSNYDVPLTAEQRASGYVGLTIDSRDISAFDDESLYDNSGGFINTSSPGAYRISNDIISFKHTNNLAEIKPIIQTGTTFTWLNGIPF